MAKHLQTCLLAACALLVGACGSQSDEQPAAAAAQVTATLMVDSSTVAAGDRLWATVTFTNGADRTAHIAAYQLGDAELEENLFAVSVDGSPVAYRGAVFKRPAPADADYLAIAPGASLSRRLDIGAL